MDFDFVKNKYFQILFAHWQLRKQKLQDVGAGPGGNGGACILVYDRNHYFGLGLIPKPKLADTFGRYCDHDQYRNHILKGKSRYR